MGVVKDVIHAARSLKAQYELQVHNTTHTQLHTFLWLLVAICG